MDKELKEFIGEKARDDACWEAYCADVSRQTKCDKCKTQFQNSEQLLEHVDDRTLCPCCCSGQIVLRSDGENIRPFCRNCRRWLSETELDLNELAVVVETIEEFER